MTAPSQFHPNGALDLSVTELQGTTTYTISVDGARYAVRMNASGALVDARALDGRGRPISGSVLQSDTVTAAEVPEVPYDPDIYAAAGWDKPRPATRTIRLNDTRVRDAVITIELTESNDCHPIVRVGGSAITPTAEFDRTTNHYIFRPNPHPQAPSSERVEVAPGGSYVVSSEQESNGWLMLFGEGRFNARGKPAEHLYHNDSGRSILIQPTEQVDHLPDGSIVVSTDVEGLHSKTLIGRDFNRYVRADWLETSAAILNSTSLSRNVSAYEPGKRYTINTTGAANESPRSSGDIERVLATIEGHPLPQGLVGSLNNATQVDQAIDAYAQELRSRQPAQCRG